MKLEDYIYSSGRGAREGGMVRSCWSSEVFGRGGGYPPIPGGVGGGYPNPPKGRYTPEGGVTL